MTPTESPDEAEWDAFHEWLDEWAGKRNLKPNQLKRIIETSGGILAALRIARGQLKIKLDDLLNDSIREDRLAIVETEIEKAEGK